MSTLFDSVNWASIPVTAPIVAGYIDGRYKWPAAAWARFPSAIKLKITVFGDKSADIGDCENGDMTVNQEAQWAHAVAFQNRIPVAYSDKSDAPLIKALCTSIPLAQWIADPTGVSHIVPGSVATQWGWFPTFDQSTTIAGWPYSIVVPAPKPIYGGGRMLTKCVGFAVTPTGKGRWLVQADGAVFAYGDAPFCGGMNGVPLVQPIVGILGTPTGKGYWLVAGDGGIFPLGDAPNYLPA